MEKNSLPQLFHLITVALFVGLSLSLAVVFLTATFLGGDSAAAPACYDGSTIEENTFFARFSRAVYQDTGMLSRVRQYEYRLFGIVNHENVIAGRNDFLFEIYDAEHDYHYLEDYRGNLAFTDAECERILQALNDRANDYREKGAEYLLVILPNAQRVYDNYMPAYLGGISSETRLSRLTAYLGAEGFTAFADVTADLRARRDGPPLYNNTENSLNALGLYYTYLAVYNRFSPEVRARTSPITMNNLEFYLHHTDGRRIAREAGLTDTVQNLTVSLSGDTYRNYVYLFNRGNAAGTLRAGPASNPSLLLKFTGNHERLQSEPFFSYTFDRVTYQLGLDDDPDLFHNAAPIAVIEFIYENELSLLLP